MYTKEKVWRVSEGLVVCNTRTVSVQGIAQRQARRRAKNHPARPVSVAVIGPEPVNIVAATSGLS